MRNAIRVISAVVVLLVASQMYSQAPTAPFSLKLDVSPSNAKVGLNIVMEVDLTNDTNKRIGLQVCLGMTVECNFEVHVRDSHGNSAPETRYLKPDVFSVAGMSIEPGETIKFFSDLPKLFDLSGPNRYEIQVDKLDSYTNRTVQSNVTHLTVSAQ